MVVGTSPTPTIPVVIQPEHVFSAGGIPRDRPRNELLQGRLIAHVQFAMVLQGRAAEPLHIEIGHMGGVPAGVEKDRQVDEVRRARRLESIEHGRGHVARDLVVGHVL